MAEARLDLVRNQLLIKTTVITEQTVILKLPSRKFLQKTQTFVVPLLRSNAQDLLKGVAEGRIALPGEVVHKLTDVATQTVGTRPFPSWYTFKTQPRPKQREALDKIYRSDAGALLMRMGSGKSKVVIDMFTAHFYERRIDAAVVICPQTVKAVWAGDRGEIMVHSPCPVAIIDVDSSFDPTAYVLSQARLFWFLVGIESLSQGSTFDRFLPFLQNRNCAIYVDESSRIKTHNTIRTKKVWQMRPYAPIRVIGTGTAVTKNLQDLYAQYEFLDPNIIGVGDYLSFRNRYAIMGGYKRKEIVGYDNVEELMGLIEPYTFRCDKPEGLPPQVFTRRVVQLSDKQREVYRRIKKGQVPGVNVKNVLTRMLHLQQVCGGFYSEDPVVEADPVTQREKKKAGAIHRLCEPHQNPKIRAVMEILDDMPEDEAVIIWAKFIWEIEDIVQALQGKYGQVAVLTGEVDTLAERVQLRDDFQAGRYKVMVANQQVGGIGHTFTRASYNIYYSNTQSLEDRLQSEDRTHRIGQNANSVTYIDLIAEHTVDQPIYDSINAKKDLDKFVRDELDKAGARREEMTNNYLLGAP